MERFWIFLPLSLALTLLIIPPIFGFVENVEARRVLGGGGGAFQWGEVGGGFGWGSGGFGGGYGGGGGGSGVGGFGRGGIFRPDVICREKGPCMNKRLVCPQSCFKSFHYSRGGRNGGGGGGGGGGSCVIDCKHKCRAYC